MVIQVPNYISDIDPYEGGRPISEVARELGIPENKIVKLASNENPNGISNHAKIAINRSLKEIERYPDGNGFYLKKTISEKFSITPQQIILGNGSNDILELAARTFVTPKEEIIYSEHAFAVYKLVSQSIGAKGIEVSAKKYSHDLNKFLSSITKNTKLIFIANPNNPTGTLIDKESLKFFLDNVPNNIVVVLDEAYDEYLSDDLKSNSFEWLKIYNNLIVSRSFSKAHGLAGLRIGYGVGSPDLIELMNRVRQPFNVNHAAQAAAIASLNDDEFIKQSRSLNNEGMKQIVDAFNKLNLEFIPSYGNFVSFKLQDENVTMLYYQHLLKNGVIVRPISNYDLPEFLRVSIGLKDENEIFIKYLSNCNI
jgi:histidinol-phosphate aminotransferase